MVLPPLGLGHHPGEGNFHAARSWNKDLACSPTSHLKWGTSTLEELTKSWTRNLVAFWTFGYKRGGKQLLQCRMLASDNWPVIAKLIVKVSRILQQWLDLLPIHLTAEYRASALHYRRRHILQGRFFQLLNTCAGLAGRQGR